MLQLPLINKVLLGAVVLAALIDLMSRKIPNWLVLSGFCIAFTFHLLNDPHDLPLIWLGGAATGFFFFLPHYLMRGMAAGDVKLMAMVGSFTGPMLALKIGLISFLFGGVIALIIVIFNRRLRDTINNVRFLLIPILMRISGLPTVPAALPSALSVGGMPYGVAIALATALTFST